MKKRCILLLLLALTVLLWGCGGKEIPLERETTSLVIIAGKHANANNFSDDMLREAKKWIERSVDYSKDGFTYSAEADIVLIVPDGDPKAEKLTVGDGIPLFTQAEDRTLFMSNVDSLLTAAGEKLRSDEVRAQEQGVDLQGALNQAKKILRKSDADKKHILILDTGISTEGNLDMRALKVTEGTLEEVMGRIDPETFPDLDGIGVTFLGLGNVAGAQPGVGENEELEERLAAFWTTYLEDKCGAVLMNEIAFEYKQGEPMFYGEDVENAYPFVPTVNFVQEPQQELGETVLPPIFSAEIGFLPDTADFRDESKALEVLEERAELLRTYFERYPDKVIYVVGSIARVQKDEAVRSDSRVSQSRAQKIADMLVSRFGFDASRFVVIDAGSHPFTWRNNDEFAGGVENPANKELNRLVALIAETDTVHVEELKEAGEI